MLIDVGKIIMAPFGLEGSPVGINVVNFVGGMEINGKIDGLMVGTVEGFIEVDGLSLCAPLIVGTWLSEEIVKGIINIESFSLGFPLTVGPHG